MKYSVINLNSARNCFRYVIRVFDIKEIFLPYYLCPVMRIAAFKEGCKVFFYHINRNFMPCCDFKENSYILYPNYFGVCNKNVDILSKKYKNLIVDNAHSFFSNPCGIAAFNSVRKFFPRLRDGAFLYIKSDKTLSLPRSVYDYETDDLTEKDFYLNEKRIDNEEIMMMSEVSMKYFHLQDLEKIKKIHIKKFKKLNNIYIDKNILKFDNDNSFVPYKYPLLFDNSYVADKFVEKMHLRNREIYRYWENLPRNFPEHMFRQQLVAI